MQHCCNFVMALLVVSLCYLAAATREVVNCFFFVLAQSTLAVGNGAINLAFMAFVRRACSCAARIVPSVSFLSSPCFSQPHVGSVLNFPFNFSDVMTM